ncbi:MAG: hypothetical protein ACXWQZ_17505 [Ktedonobacterales bacterium]
MRVMIKYRIPVEVGNELVRTGKIGQLTQRILDDLKPEAAYFFPEGGVRSGLIVVDLRDASQIPEVSERFFRAYNASVEMTPVMVAEDLRKALPGVEEVVKTYG